MMYAQIMTRPRKTEQFAARLTDEGAALLVESARRKGVTRAAIVEMAIREYAEKRGISPDPASKSECAKDGE